MNQTEYQSVGVSPLVPKSNDHNPMGIAVDWVNDHLYWTDYTSHKISVSHLNGSWPTLVTNTKQFTPRSIAVHPGKG